MRRNIFASAETMLQAKRSPNKLVKVYSFFPVDRADCVCQPEILNWKRRIGTALPKDRVTMLEQTPFFECPRKKDGLTRYVIKCSVCGDEQGYCYASTPELLDWCDFHYVQWTKGDIWHGCFTPHISPVTQTLAFECCCGNDTRDFRANMTLNTRVAEKIEKMNAVGRAFNQPDSKFLVSKLKGNVIK